eukprot:TRINITY_DN19172_c0_g1_i1.p1 TRINITY_DN19172_c0_g1~~TRINITY_DN19172_c0_g1_i1.p1  ORF type:complete len:156 (-),score=29.92 TRINITY_DN19172_c0_g1_i1:368-835(-)
MDTSSPAGADDTSTPVRRADRDTQPGPGTQPDLSLSGLSLQGQAVTTTTTTTNTTSPGTGSDTTIKQDNETRPAVLTARSYLGLNARVTVSDGRIVQGTLWCFDKTGSVLLRDSVEYRKYSVVGQGDREESRHLGLALIPKSAIVSSFVEVPQVS